MQWCDASDIKRLPIDCWSIESIASIIRFQSRKSSHLSNFKKKNAELDSAYQSKRELIVYLFSRNKKKYLQWTTNAGSQLVEAAALLWMPTGQRSTEKGKIAGNITIGVLHRATATYFFSFFKNRRTATMTIEILPKSSFTFILLARSLVCSFVCSFIRRFIQFVLCLVSSNSISIYHIIIIIIAIIFNNNSNHRLHTRIINMFDVSVAQCLCLCIWVSVSVFAVVLRESER